MGAPAFATLQHVLQAVAHRAVTPGLLDVFLRLFDGHDTPATYWAQGRRPGYYQSPGMTRALAFEAHLLGAVLVGSYPFRGVVLGCSCPSRSHTCDGAGCRYLCLDLDAHRGETDTAERCHRLLAVAWRNGFLPVVFSSRSGRGAHIYIFFTETVTTREAHAAGVALARAAGIESRCDVIPSGEHHAGLGTLHALPCSPMSEPGGGLLFDANLSPVVELGRVVSLLQWADAHRTPAYLVRNLAMTGEVVACPPSARQVVRHVVKPARVVERRAAPTKDDASILEEMRDKHPQFRKALATPVAAWRGRRSARDAYLVSYMRRQGVSPAGIVEAMREIPDTKALERGDEYVWSLVAGRPWFSIVTRFAGQQLQPGEVKKMRAEFPTAPWSVREPPPQRYDNIDNPWWAASTQAKLCASSHNRDGIVLAYLVDRYYRGPIKRRMFYASQRGVGKELGIPARTVGVIIKRLASTYGELLRVVPGVSHPVLRIANGFYVPERSHRDSLDWYVGQPRR